MKIVDENTLKIVDTDDTTEFTSKLKSAMGNCTSTEFYEKYNNWKKAEAEFNAVYEPFKERLIKLYKLYEDKDFPKTIVMGGGAITLTYVAPSTRTTIDSKKLKEEEPEIAKKFSKTTNVKASIRLKEI